MATFTITTNEDLLDKLSAFGRILSAKLEVTFEDKRDAADAMAEMKALGHTVEIEMEPGPAQQQQPLENISISLETTKPTRIVVSGHNLQIVLDRGV